MTLGFQNPAKIKYSHVDESDGLLIGFQSETKYLLLFEMSNSSLV